MQAYTRDGVKLENEIVHLVSKDEILVVVMMIAPMITAGKTVSAITTKFR